MAPGNTGQPQAEREILEDRHRERDGHGKHHPDSSPQQRYVHFLAVDRDPFQESLTRNQNLRIQIDHTIAAAQEGRLSRARRSNNRQNLSAASFQRYPL